MTDLHRNIARRKLVDAAFAMLGAFLIVASLGTLAILVGDLMKDGAGRLTSTTLLKADGSAPSRRDVVGRIQRAEGAEGGWLLARTDMPLDTAGVETDLAPLERKRVIVSGNAPGPDEPVEVDSVTPIPDPASGEDAPRVGRRDTVGVLKRDKDAKDPALAWTLVPDKLRLQTEGMAFDFAAHENKPVALIGKRTSGGVMTVDSLEPLTERSFFASMPSRRADRAGIFSAWVGSLLVMFVTMCTAVPLGVAAGVYLEEYARKNWWTSLIEVNIANLAGVPSIVWGLMALGLIYGVPQDLLGQLWDAIHSRVWIFSHAMDAVAWVFSSIGWLVGKVFSYRPFSYLAQVFSGVRIGRNVLTAGLTLGLLVLPIVIVATREAIRAIPAGIRDASIALGATKWETVRHHVLPYSFGGILTGIIVSLSRAIGETAPLITIGALTYVAFLPESPVQDAAPFVNTNWLDSPFTVLPIQMFNWVSRPDAAFHNNAAAAGVVLIAMTLSLNAVAIFLRYRLRRSIKW